MRLYNIYLLYSLPVLFRESKDRVVQVLAMAVEELQMPWYDRLETYDSDRACRA
jgi:hypothetical protein